MSTRDIKTVNSVADAYRSMYAKPIQIDEDILNQELIDALIEEVREEELNEVSLSTNMLQKDFANVWASKDSKLYRVLDTWVRMHGFVDNAKAYKKNPKAFIDSLKKVASNPEKYKKEYGNNFPQYINKPNKNQSFSESVELTEAMSKQMTVQQYANKIGIDAKEKQWIMDNEPDMVAYFPNDKLKGSWNALSYPVRTGDYYFAFLTGDDDKRKKAASDANMKMNDLLKSELATAKKLKFDGEPYTEDMIASYLWNKVYAAFEKLPRNLGPGDTMTREELYRAINDITGGEVQFESFDYQGETIQEGMVSGMLGKILNKIRNARKKIGKKIKLGRKAKIGKVHEDVMTTYRLMSEAQPIGSVGIRQDHQSDSNRDARVADWKKKKSEETKVEALQKKLEFARKQRQRHDDAAERYREQASKVRERNPDDRAADGYDNKADRQEEMADNQNNKVQDIKDEIRKAKGIKEEQVKPFFDTYKDMMQEEVANITVDKQNKISKSSDQNAKALLVHDAAKRMGLKSSMVGKHVRVKGTKKKIQDFMMVVIGKSSYGDPTEQDTSTPQIDKMLSKGFSK